MTVRWRIAAVTGVVVALVLAAAIVFAVARWTQRSPESSRRAEPVTVSTLRVSTEGDLSWPAVPKASRYVVVGARQGSGDRWVWEGASTTIRFGTESADWVAGQKPITVHPGSYRWCLLAYDKAGRLLAASAPARFRCPAAQCAASNG